MRPCPATSGSPVFFGGPLPALLANIHSGAPRTRGPSAARPWPSIRSPQRPSRSMRGSIYIPVLYTPGEKRLLSGWYLLHRKAQCFVTALVPMSPLLADALAAVLQLTTHSVHRKRWFRQVCVSEKHRETMLAAAWLGAANSATPSSREKSRVKRKATMLRYDEGVESAHQRRADALHLGGRRGGPLVAAAECAQKELGCSVTAVPCTRIEGVGDGGGARSSRGYERASLCSC